MSNAHFTQPTFTNGQVVEGWNLAQHTPHTAIGVGVTGLTFRKCNLTNCDVPADAAVEDCLVGHGSFCTNLWPELIGFGLAACAENCSHVVGTDQVIVDGVVQATIYHYQNTRVD